MRCIYTESALIAEVNNFLINNDNDYHYNMKTRGSKIYVTISIDINRRKG